MRGNDLPQVKLDYVVPKGGLDLVTPPLLMPPGACRAAQNFEVDLEGGYSRIGGYERWSYVPPAAKATFYTATIQLYTAGPATRFGHFTIRGVTSGATARVLPWLSDAQVEAARTGQSDQRDFLNEDLGRRFYIYQNVPLVVFLYEVKGTFIEGEGLATLTENQLVEYSNPSGTGVYAFPVDLKMDVAPVLLSNTNPLSYATELDRALIAYSLSVSLPDSSSAAEYTTLAIETLRGRPIVLASVKSSQLGNTVVWAYVPDAVSPIVLSASAMTSYPYGWFPADVLQSMGITVDAEYLEVVRYNFSGAADGERLYMVWGEGKAFRVWLASTDPPTTDASVITTGMATDAPEHIAVHKHRLFLSFGSSLQFSAAGDPDSWTPVLGAGELAVGEQITKLQSVIGGETSVLLVYTTTRIYGLYGDTSSNFNLVLLASDIRVDPKSIQMFGQPIFLTDRGVMFLNAVDSFGNFKLDAVSNQVAPMLKRLTGRLASSIVIPEKNQYRLFFDTGDALFFTFAGTKLIGVMPIFYDRVPEVVHLFHDERTSEDLFLFASRRVSRRIYRGDIGPSFDCRTIDSYFFLSFNASKTARVNKAYRHAALELQSEEGYVTFKASFEADYAARQTFPTPEPDVAGSAVNAYSAYDDALWDEFYWDGNKVSPQELSIDGSGENFSLGVSSSSYLTWPFTLSGVILHYFIRRIKRG